MPVSPYRIHTFASNADAVWPIVQCVSDPYRTEQLPLWKIAVSDVKSCNAARFFFTGNDVHSTIFTR